MKRILIDDTTIALKKKLTVQPYLPGSPVVVSYCMYKIHENYIYIPKYFDCSYYNYTFIFSININIYCRIIFYNYSDMFDILYCF